MNKIKILSLLSILFGAQAVLAAAVDPCTGLIVTATSALIDMNTNDNVGQTLTVSRSATSGGCDYFVVVDNNGGATYNDRYLTHGPDLLAMQIYKEAANSNVLRSVNEASTVAHVFSDKLTGSNSKTHIYYPKLGSTNVPVGPYTGSFTYAVYKWTTVGDFSTKTYMDQKSVNYKYTSENNISLSLVDTGSPYNAADISQTLDFGSLTSNEFLGFDLVLQYTSGYKLSMSSVNAGKIKNANTAYTSNNTIDYTLALNSAPVTLTSVSTEVAAGTGTAPSGGTRLPVLVTIGTVGGVYPGTYSDTVSIKIAAP